MRAGGASHFQGLLPDDRSRDARIRPPRRVDGASGTRTSLKLHAIISFSTIHVQSWCSGCGPHNISRAANLLLPHDGCALNRGSSQSNWAADRLST